MEWLQQNQAAIEVLLAATTLLAMSVVIYLNYKAEMLSELAIQETRRAREQEYRPYVYFQVYTDNRTRAVNFRLVNRGRSVARNIQLNLDHPVYVEADKTVDDLAVFQGLSFLAPQGEFEEYAGFPNSFFRANEDLKVITGIVSYEDTSGNQFKSSVRVPLQVLHQRMSFEAADFHALVESVEDIERVMQRKAIANMRK
ncbi:MAG: hypothetical protein EP343_22050 [Deltaproteobacteria bacterium]|nr:MAG: hypothetical protein EP343_22050 [Deltaproteobacteria bacterium]